ncbi:MAG TPA: FtsX-like permease family protein, partial [Candidatus Angelobacter sp.]|nr:FtsX-like permease family protein [Candidatus Angelobacter sp.]
VLAAIGLYGLLANAVQQRTREIGIRMALGAETGDVFRMVVGHGLKLALAGVAIGIAAALVLTRVLSSLSHLIYGVGLNDPVTIVSVSLLLVAVAALACYVPARRATHVAPTLALRQE